MAIYNRCGLSDNNGLKQNAHLIRFLRSNMQTQYGENVLLCLSIAEHFHEAFLLRKNAWLRLDFQHHLPF